jgi:hypothetical protein
MSSSSDDQIGYGRQREREARAQTFFNTARPGLLEPHSAVSTRVLIADEKPPRSDGDITAPCDSITRLGEPDALAELPSSRAEESLDLFAHPDRARYVDGAPNSTVEALVFELRTDGLAALNEPSCIRRIDDISAAQLREVLGRLIKLRPKYPLITDDLLLKIGRLL